MAKKIFVVGFEIPANEVESVDFRSNRSLLDADIIVFQPTIPYYSSGRFQGKLLLDEDDSFRLKENIQHWRDEIYLAIQAGKTVIMYLPAIEEVFIHTGNRQVSGTGRNQKVTNLVEPISNYRAFPIDIGPVIASHGNEIQVAADLGPLTSYWTEFGKHSNYEAYLVNTISGTVLTTKTGGKTVSAIVTANIGRFVLLPSIAKALNKLVNHNKGTWKADAVKFGKRWIALILEIDALLRQSRTEVPPPEWSQGLQFTLQAEAELLSQIEQIDGQVQILQAQREDLRLRLSDEGRLRHLLYEQGHLLEEAILRALSILGYSAERYKESDSEFDAVFVSQEGRFLGEAEGKTNKPINIDKLSQLERNIQEDYSRDDVTEYAKGVLFGNAFRLAPLEDRAKYFTDKCVSGAKRSKVALVRTPDLFEVAKYLSENDDSMFAQACREAIKRTEGDIVQFPTPSGSNNP